MIGRRQGFCQQYPSSTLRLSQRFRTRAICPPPLPLPGDIRQCLETLLVVQWGWWWGVLWVRPEKLLKLCNARDRHTQHGIGQVSLPAKPRLRMQIQSLTPSSQGSCCYNPQSTSVNSLSLKALFPPEVLVYSNQNSVSWQPKESN